jgi:uncharacterized membrane protein YphA (DoxX/SURF4 family)
MARKKDFSALSKNSGIAFVLLGVILASLGIYLKTSGFEGIPDDFNLYWIATGFAFLIGIMNLSMQEGIVKSTYLARIVVGALFVVSGLIKANDPLGFSFKLEEYFEPDALGWVVFMPYAMGLSILIAGAEILLGLALLVGGLVRLTTWLLFGMILFFAWLTYFTASCNDNQRNESAYISAINEGDSGLMSGEWDRAEVNYEEAVRFGDQDAITPRFEALSLLKEGKATISYDSIYYYEMDGQRVDLPVVLATHRQCVLDCGCFGDALKGSIGRSLTPWESFLKDLILLILVIPILLMQKHIHFNKQNDDVLIIFGTLLFSFLVGKVLFDWWLPIVFVTVFFLIYLTFKRLFKSEKVQVGSTAITGALLSFSFVFYTYTYLPVKDYRPYAIGNNLTEQMNNAEEGEFANVFVYKNKASGDLVEFTQDEYMANWEEIDANHIFIRKKTNIIKDVKPASIQDFRPIKMYPFLTEEELSASGIQSEIEKVYDQYFESVHVVKDVKYGYIDSVPETEYDPEYYPVSDSTYAYLGKSLRKIKSMDDLEVNFTSHLLSLSRVLVITSYKLGESTGKGEEQKWEFLNEDKWLGMIPLIVAAKSAGIPVYAITSAPRERTEEFKAKLGIDAEFLIMDPIEIKIIVRSNPGMVYIENAVVKGKWDYNRIPQLEQLK